MVEGYHDMRLAREPRYICMILSVFEPDEFARTGDYPGQIRDFGEGVDVDEFVGEMNLPAIL